MTEYKKPLKIIYDPRLNNPYNLENPTINQELVYKFLDKSEEFHNNGGHVSISPELQKEFDLAFPELNIKDRYQPDNNGWYHKKLEEKVKKQEKLGLKNDSLDETSNVLQARQVRAANMMNLVNKVLLENDIPPAVAQELSFQSVSKALDRNPNLILNNEIDVKSSNEITNGLRPGINKLKPKPSDEDNAFKERKDLTEENAKELQAFMTNQMMFQLEQFNQSNILSTAIYDEKNYKDLAFREASMDNANTSIGLKNNINALRQEFNSKPTQSKKKPPTPMDDLLDPMNTRK